MRLIYLITVCLCACLVTQGYAQDSTLMKKTAAKYAASVSSKAGDLEKKINKQSLRVLKKMQKLEAKLQGKLARVDSAESKRLFANSSEKYDAWKEKLTQPTAIVSPQAGRYIAYMDTLKTSFSFLNHHSLLANDKEVSDKLQAVQKNLDGLESKFGQAEAFQQFLKERRQYLKEQLSKFNMVKQLKGMNKEVYYYAQAVKNYKEMFKDRRKIEQKAIGLLRESSVFKKFMQNNSQLASLFGFSSAGGSNLTPVSMTGLQTRAAIQQQISSSAIMGNNPQQFLNQQLQTANQQLSQQKNTIKFPSLEENLGEMPDFKPNQQKTKSFLQRLEYGLNIQFGKTNNYLPSTGELAATVGYKLNDNGTLGVGASYKLGLGSGFSRIRFSSQGYGLRSYLDWKIKGSIYISGGYEKNYLPELNNIETPVPPGLESWQESGLIGLTKKHSIGKKRKGTIQILFDFLSYKNMPRSRPIVFRTGINF
ncbi:MAG: hypothetical protein E6Q24_18110 [Chitinophagaceae bacterium]|nr:MAG: hypothetical protein E6Q24_18110 [Chitinophagaceae bacterium]